MASLNYMLSNLGYAISSILAYFFLRKNQTLLLFLDVITTGVACFTIGYYGATQKFKNSNTVVKTKDIELEQDFKWPDIIRTPRIWAVMFATLPIFMCLASSFSIVQVIFSEKGLDYIKLSTVVVGISSVAVIIGYYTLKVLKPNDSVKIIGGGLLLGVGVMLLSCTTNLIDCLIFSVVWSLGEILIIGEASTIFYKVIPAEYPGLAAGLKVGTLRLAFVICPLLITILGRITTFNLTLSLSIPCLVGAIWLYKLKVAKSNLSL